MNRSLTNVLFGGIAQTQANKKIEGEVTTTAIEETVDALASAENVIIVCIQNLKILGHANLG
jgi:NAD(P) transhydrogenase